MVFPTVIHGAVDAVRAYFQRNSDKPLPPMDFVDIPPVALPVMRLAYLLLATVFILLASVSTFVGIGSGYLRDALWIISLGFCCLSAALIWTRGFLVFYFGWSLLCLTGMLASVITSSCDKFAMYDVLVGFLGYTTLYSQVMIERIVKGDANYVKHAVFFFTDLPYILFHFGRILLRSWRDVFLLIYGYIKSNVLGL